MFESRVPDSLDLEFQVPSTHRLRFTNDIFAGDQEVLADLLETSPGRTPKVQFWVDECVAQANPDLKSKIRNFAQRYKDSIELAGNVQFITGGEDVKNDIHVMERMLKVINAHDLDRRSYIIVIGGGAVLDAVGFAAAIAHRGIRLIRIPTTTLAQADSGVGVKNSVNLFHKKNWVGTFAVPWAVINDANLLRTLPERDFRCGFSEAIKVALLKDATFFNWLCEHAGQIRNREPDVCSTAIRESSRWHIRHITEGGDPFEALEARPLDFGHWSAHKLEVMTDFAVKHGEAVAMGVGIDCLYSARTLGLDRKHAVEAIRALTEMGIAMWHPLLEESTTLFEGLEEFRQHLGGRLTITMLNAPGEPVNVHEIDQIAMQESMDELAEMVSATSDRT
ncbi:MAG: 3-dehydroquinate synthase [Planctomycetaceae bacterium]|nr:3-dehydroquinate synthase [Planctomycetaceae bacterium]